MNGFLRQNTAATVVLGPIVNSSTAAPENGLTITQADVRLSKNGAAFAQKNDSAAATYMENGQYACALNTTDTNALGILHVTVYESGTLIWWGDFSVVTANWYDSMFSSDRLQVHVDEMTANIITAATIAADAVDGDAIAASAVTEIQAGLATAAAVATVAGYIDTEVASILSAVTSILANVDTEIAAILAKVNNLPASPAAVGSAMTLAANSVNASAVAADAVTEIQAGLATAAALAALNNLSAAQVNAEVVDALSVDAYAEPGSVPPATASIVAMIHWLYTLARNKRLTTATSDRVRNDADSADIGTAGLSDDGTAFTRGEYA